MIKASKKAIYDALTTQEGLASWWTHDTKVEEGKFNHFRFGEEYYKKMKITQLDEPTKLTWECTKGHEEWIGTHISFELVKNEENIYLRFAHLGWAKETDFFGSCNYHWGYYLESLKQYCETGEGKPFEG